MRFFILLPALWFLAAPATAAAPPAGPRHDVRGEVLPEGAVARFGAARLRYAYPRHLALSPDNKTLALGTDGGIRVWDLKTGRVLATQHLEGVRRGFLTFTPGGAQVVCDESGVRILDGRGGKRTWLKPPATGMAPVEVAFSPTGKRVAVVWRRATPSGSVIAGATLYDPAEPEKTGRALIAGDVAGLHFSADGTLLAGFADRTIHLWDGRTGKSIRTSTSKEKNEFAIRTIRLSPDGKKLAVAHGGRTRLYRTDSGDDVPGFTPPPMQVEFLRFSGDGKALIGCEYRNVIRWSAETGKELSRFAFTVGPELGPLTLSAHGDLLAGASCFTGAVGLWDTAAGRERPRLEQPLLPLRGILFTGKETVAGIRADGSVVFFSTKDGRVLREHRAPAKLARYATVGLSPRGDLFAASDDNGKFTVYELSTRRELWHLDFPKDESLGLFAFSPDGQTLLLAKDDRVRLVEAATGRELRRIDRFETSAAAFAPDGRTLAGGLADPVFVYELASGKVRQRLKCPSSRGDDKGVIFDICFSRGGNTLAVYRRGDLYVYDLASGREVFHQAYPDRGDNSEYMALSPDGRWLAHGGYYEEAFRLRDLRGYRPDGRVQLGGHVDRLAGLLFSPDGKHIVSASRDGSALVWDLEIVRSIRRHRGPVLAPPEELWSGLGSADAEAAGLAMRHLQAHPEQAVALLRERLRPAPPGPGRARIDGLIADLGKEDYAVRSAALRELERLRELAGPAVRAALAKKPDLDLKRRLELLREKLAAPETDPAVLRAMRAVEVLERVGSADACAVLEKVAGGEPGARLTREARASIARLSEK